jgi:tetratricopeptide (TPR) repeat protein
MIVTYSWQLESDKIYNNVPPSKSHLDDLDMAEDFDTSIDDVNKIRDTLPTDEGLRLAQGLANDAYIDIQKKDWRNALKSYRTALVLVERFRSPEVISFVKELLYFSARCAMNIASPIAAVLFIKKALLIGDIPESYISLYEKANSEDKERISTFIDDFQKDCLPTEKIKPLIDYLLYYPLHKRINTAREILEGCLKKNPNDQAAMLYGCISETVRTIELT